MSLTAIRSSLMTAEARAQAWRMSLESWAAEQEILAQKVALFRDYADGDHRANLSTEMQAMLRITTTGSMNRFNANYCAKVIEAESSRLTVKAFEADNQAATDWINALKEVNRFDGLQGDVHDAALLDGFTGVMASWDKELKRIVWTHEPAYDGVNGVLFRFDPFGRVQVAIKTWIETLGEDPVTRVTLYWPDRIERYIGNGEGGGLQPYQEEGEQWPAPWTTQGRPIGVAIIPFLNRPRTGALYGLSEIENVVPLQDALNRTLTSLIMASELTAFQVRYAIGFQPPAALAPGSWVIVSGDSPPSKDDRVELGVMDTGEVMPYVQAADWLIQQIGKVTDTPLPEFGANDNASGESLKQREVGLLAKVRKFQVKTGNAWEDLLRLSWQVTAAFGSTPPAFTTLTTRWDDAEIRNDQQIRENAKALIEMGLIEEGLRQLAPLFDWDEEKIKTLAAERVQNQAAVLGNLNLPTFDQAFSTLGAA